MTRARPVPDFGTLVRDFFCERLLGQQNVSPHTSAAYRDTIRLLLAFLAGRGIPPARVALADVDAPTVLAFLDDLERRRGNAVRTRNARLTAVRAFVSYAATRDPAALPLVRRVLAIPSKRFDRPVLGHLSRPEVEAILDAPSAAAWSGRRDRALFTVLYNTGARVSEALGLSRADVSRGPVAAVRLHGKGRKERCVPLWKATGQLLSGWLDEVGPGATAAVFPNRHGGRLSRSGVEERLRRAVATAAGRCPSLRAKRVSPHTLRHTTAMHLLQAGTDLAVIALWLGHESVETTHQYLEADLEMKRRVLGQVAEPETGSAGRRQREDLLSFLDNL